MATFTPGIPYVSSNLMSKNRVYISESRSGIIRQRKVPGQLYSFNMKFRTMTKAEAFAVVAFLEANVGVSFTTLHSQHRTPLGVEGGTPLIKGASQTGKSITTDGWTSSTNGLMLAGDVISFGTNGSKVYKLAADVNSDGSGNATMTLVQDLTGSPADNAVINTTGVLFNVVLNRSDQNHSTNNNNEYTITLAVTESL